MSGGDKDGRREVKRNYEKTGSNRRRYVRVAEHKSFGFLQKMQRNNTIHPGRN